MCTNSANCQQLAKTTQQQSLQMRTKRWKYSKSTASMCDEFLSAQALFRRSKQWKDRPRKSAQSNG